MTLQSTNSHSSHSAHSMKFLAQQHLHNSHVTTQIQTLLSPYVLPLLVSLLMLVGYRTLLQRINSLTLDNITDLGGAVVLKNSTLLSLNSTSWDAFSDLRNDLEDQRLDTFESFIEFAVNSTTDDYDCWMNNTVSMFENVFDAVLEKYESHKSYASKITKLVKGLNTTVISDLVEKNSELVALQSEISDSISVGGSIDVNDLSIDVSGYLDDFSRVLDGLKFATDDVLVSLNKSRDTIVEEIQKIFDDAVATLEDFNRFASTNSSSSKQSTKVTLSRSSSTTKTTSTNGTQMGDISTTSSTSESLKPALIFLGCCIVIAYVLISVLNHFHFQYTSKLRKDTYLQSMESTTIGPNDDTDVDSIDQDLDMEKVMDNTTHEHVEENFNSIHYRLKSPFITMCTDLTSRITGSWYSTYWCVEYLTLRLPLFVVAMVAVAVVILGVDKTHVSTNDLAATLSSNSSQSNTTDLYTVELSSLTLEDFDYSDQIDSWNDFVEILHANVTSSLSDLFVDYSITSALSITPPVLTPSPFNITSKFNLSVYNLPNISLTAETRLEVSTTSSVLVSSLRAYFVSKAAQTLQKTVIETCLIALSVLGGLGVLILVIGVVYAFLM